MDKERHEVGVTNEQIDAAISRAKEFAADDPRVISAEYQVKEELVKLYFADGMLVAIPRHRLQGLQHARQSQLSKIEIVGHGTGVRWPLLDVDHYVAGILGHVFGTRRWMEQIGRRGGLAKSKAKAAAARANGQKGGRPSRRAIR